MEKETLLRTPSSETNIQTINGVTYFKLQPGYPNDVTKNCGLTGDEVDKNFYFLRGNDIDTIEFDDNYNLTITRVNKNDEPIVVNFSCLIDKPSFSLDRETGVLTVTFSDGETTEIDGFLVDYASALVYTDETIRGNGRKSNRLGLSPVEVTGQPSPVEKLIDLTTGEEMPDTTTCGVGYRVLIKDNIDWFGYLYDYQSAMAIQEMLELEGNGWRIPTREEWDAMLNGFECVDNRNHSEPVGEAQFGYKAGVALKSAGTTRDNDGLWKWPNSYEACGNNNSGLAIQPIGGGGYRNAYMNDDDYDIEGVQKMGYYWTKSQTDNGRVFIKIFTYDSGMVKQGLVPPTDMAGIRLVKDYDNGVINNYETILGRSYPIKLVSSIYEDYDYTKLWTKINVYDDSDALGGIHTTLSGDSPSTYCVCEWNGNEWVKKNLNEGDCIVITSNGHKEYMLVNGELVEVFYDIYESLSATTDYITSLSEELNNELDMLSYRIREAESDISDINENIGNIQTRLETTESNIVEIRSEINTNSGHVSSIISELSSSTQININNLNTNISELSSSTINQFATKNELNDVQTNIENALSEFITEEGITRILDVKCEDNQIFLEKSDGTYTQGFPISKILGKSLISDIEYDEVNKIITFVFGDSYSTRIPINISDLVDVYTVDSGSTNYLNITNNKIGVYVNNSNGRLNTLATTNYVDSSSESAVAISNRYTISSVTSLSGNITTTLNEKAEELESKISQNKNSIDLLNGPYNTPGSIEHYIQDSLIVDGLPITTITVDDARSHSLLRSIVVNGEKEYFVTNSAKAMVLNTSDNTEVNLNDYIMSLKDRISELESIIGSQSGQTSNLERLIKSVVASYLSGTNNEIKITRDTSNDLLRIGFADDAMFGPISL